MLRSNSNGYELGGCMEKTIAKLLEIREKLESQRSWSSVALIDEAIFVATNEKKELENLYKSLLQLP